MKLDCSELELDDDDDDERNATAFCTCDCHISLKDILLMKAATVAAI